MHLLADAISPASADCLSFAGAFVAQTEGGIS